MKNLKSRLLFVGILSLIISNSFAQKKPVADIIKTGTYAFVVDSISIKPGYATRTGSTPSNYYAMPGVPIPSASTIGQSLAVTSNKDFAKNYEFSRLANGDGSYFSYYDIDTDHAKQKKLNFNQQIFLLKNGEALSVREIKNPSTKEEISKSLIKDFDKSLYVDKIKQKTNGNTVITYSINGDQYKNKLYLEIFPNGRAKLSGDPEKYQSSIMFGQILQIRNEEKSK